jgi:hypothetical protein
MTVTFDASLITLLAEVDQIRKRLALLTENSCTGLAVLARNELLVAEFRLTFTTRNLSLCSSNK